MEDLEEGTLYKNIIIVRELLLNNGIGAEDYKLRPG